MEQESSGHTPVLLEETLTALIADNAGVYIDGTFGRGGHSKAILEKLSGEGRLIAFDKDHEAIAVGRTLAKLDSRFEIYHGSFTEMQQVLSKKQLMGKVNGVLLDLGVSSPQLETAARGFSFILDGPLDMRMNNTVGESAEEWINRASASDIAYVLKYYGEEKFAKRMANAIIQQRQMSRINSTKQLAQILSEANPSWEKGKHPATRAFQAIRIYVNSELEDLNLALNTGLEVLKRGGRYVVISFHSLEDRLVKRFFRDQSRGKTFPKNIPVTDEMLEKRMKIIGKPIKPSEGEIQNNIRSRSAVMRAAEKIL